MAQRSLPIKDGNNTFSIKNTQNNVVYVRVLNSGKLPLGEEISEQRGLSVSVVYKDLKGNTIDIGNFRRISTFPVCLYV